jgi:hypothetical protein
MAADWAKIEAEYITSDTSYRKLAEKYGLNQATVAQKAKADDWVSKRKQHASSTRAEILDRDKDIKVDRATKLSKAADQLLNKIVQGIESATMVTPTAAKNYSDALKNIKDIHMIRSEEDIEEQRARIAKLQKDVADDRDKTIVVTLEGDLSRYAQ